MKTIEEVKVFIEKNLKHEKDKKMPIHNDYESGFVHGNSYGYAKILDYLDSEKSNDK